MADQPTTARQRLTAALHAHTCHPDGEACAWGGEEYPGEGTCADVGEVGIEDAVLAWASTISDEGTEQTPLPTGNLGGVESNYFTVQMSRNAPGGEHLIHLGAYNDRGGLGPILCGLDRFARGADGKTMYGFSCGGGYYSGDAEPCPDCLAVYRQNPGPVSGSVFAGLFKLGRTS